MEAAQPSARHYIQRPISGCIIHLDTQHNAIHFRPLERGKRHAWRSDKPKGRCGYG